MLRAVKSKPGIVVSLTCTAYRYSSTDSLSAGSSSCALPVLLSRIAILAILTSCILFNISCSSSPGNDAKAAGPDSSFKLIDLPRPTPLAAGEAERIAKGCELFYDTTLKPKGFNGGIIVAKGGNIIFEKYYGTGHLPGKDTITAETPFHVASVSKTFTAMAVLKLQEEGKLNIDDELVKYMPKFNYPGVTIRSLLDHRSGLPNYTYFMEEMGWDKNAWVTNLDIFSWMTVNKSLMIDVAPPETKFNYSNTNYALLEILIEVVSGSSYPEYLERSFFGPLQMKHTFVFAPADSNRVIPSYDWKGRLMPMNFLDGVTGDKNIYTTCRDLLTWDRGLSSGLLFRPETLLQAYKGYSNERPGVKNYGLGWHLAILPNGKRIIFYNGWWHGNNAAFIRLLDEDATIIVTGNRFTRAVYAAKQLANLFGDYGLPVEEEETDLARSPDSLQTFNAPTYNPPMVAPGYDPRQLPPKKLSKEEMKLQELLKDKHKEQMIEQSRKL